MSKKIIGFLVVFVLILGSITFYFWNENKILKEDVADLKKEDGSVSEVERNNDEIKAGFKKIKEESLEETIDNVYFGVGDFENGYYLVNTRTGEKENFVPEGYEIISQHAYNSFSDKLILKQDNKLYSFDIKNDSIKEIVGISVFPRNNDEDGVSVILRQSTTDKNDFIIEIYSYNDTDFGIPEVKRKETYLYNSLNNKVTKSFFGFDVFKDFVYDSKNEKFFSWYSGEGAGSVAPIKVSNLSGSVINEIFKSKNENSDNLVRVRQNEEIFILVPFKKNNINNYDLKYFNINDFNKIKEIKTGGKVDFVSAYSLVVDEKTKTLVAGYNGKVTLYRFNDQNFIQESKIITEDTFYPNFIFVENGKLYYLNSGNNNIKIENSSVIKVVDLNTWEIDNVIEISDASLNEITLFKK